MDSKCSLYVTITLVWCGCNLENDTKQLNQNTRWSGWLCQRAVSLERRTHSQWRTEAELGFHMMFLTTVSLWQNTTGQASASSCFSSSSVSCCSCCLLHPLLHNLSTSTPVTSGLHNTHPFDTHTPITSDDLPTYPLHHTWLLCKNNYAGSQDRTSLVVVMWTTDITTIHFNHLKLNQI